jgi:hypothetical protein
MPAEHALQALSRYTHVCYLLHGHNAINAAKLRELLHRIPIIGIAGRNAPLGSGPAFA